MLFADPALLTARLPAPLPALLPDLLPLRGEGKNEVSVKMVANSSLAAAEFDACVGCGLKGEMSFQKVGEFLKFNRASSENQFACSLMGKGHIRSVSKIGISSGVNAMGWLFSSELKKDDASSSYPKDEVGRLGRSSKS